MTEYTIANAPVIVDGMPHLAYFDRDAQLSFLWSGRLNEPIHVQYGGYGEPTIELIDPQPVFNPPVDPAELFDWYRDVCDNWTVRWDGAPAEPGEPLFGVEQIAPGAYVVRI